MLRVDHPDITTSINNLAAILGGRGDLHGDEKLYRQTLTLGPADMEKIIYRSNLAGVLIGQGRYDEAESNLRNITELSTEVSGREGSPRLQCQRLHCYAGRLAGQYQVFLRARFPSLRPPCPAVLETLRTCLSPQLSRTEVAKTRGKSRDTHYGLYYGLLYKTSYKEGKERTKTRAKCKTEVLLLAKHTPNYLTLRYILVATT